MKLTPDQQNALDLCRKYGGELVTAKLYRGEAQTDVLHQLVELKLLRLIERQSNYCVWGLVEK